MEQFTFKITIRRALIVVGIYVIAISSVFALTKDELNNMPKEKVKKLPAIEVMSMEGMGMSRQIVNFIFENTLIDLRYYFKRPTGSSSKELTDAIKDFQSDIGSQPTGILTMGEFDELQKRHSATDTIPVYPSGPTFTDFGNTIYADGTWVFEENAFPLQFTKLRCFRQSMECVVATTILSVQMIGSNDQGRLELELEFLPVTKWNDVEINAEIKDSRCVTYTLIITRKTKKVFQVRRGKGLEGCEGIATSPEIINLEKGFGVAYEFWQKQNEKQRKNLSSKYREWLKSISMLKK